MEEETKVSSEVPVDKGAPEDLKTVNVSVKDVKGEMTKEDKVMEKDEEDTTFDGGFVKVYKEGIDTKDQVPVERSSSSTQRELHESQDKVKALELKLEKVTWELRRYESENTLLKDDIVSKKVKLGETEKKHEELEVVNKKLQEKIGEGEERHRSQLKSLEDALKLHDVKHKELTEIKKAFDGLSIEVENSKSRWLETEQKISSKEALIQELNQELEKKKASEYRFEEELLALKDLKSKLSEQESINLKLREEIKEKESQTLSNNSDLEQKLKALEELSEEVSQLTSALIVAEEEEKDSVRQMQGYQEKVTKLEWSLNQSSVRISELEEDLRTALQKGAEHEDLANVSTQRRVELEGLFQTSQSKLQKAEEKLKDFEAFKVRNSSLEAALSVAMEKLKSAEERLEKQARELDEATSRSIELEDLHKHSMEEFSSRDMEAKLLTEKSKDLEERIRLYEDKLAEASAHSFSLKEDLDQSSLENELISHTNDQLKIKIQELEGYLDAEKETVTRQTEEAKDLITKLKSHENLIEEHKRQVLEASLTADARKMELEGALSKLEAFEATIKDLEKENGSLAEVNLKLNQELANHGSDTRDFQAMFSALEAEKDKTAKELHASKTAIDDLTNQLTSERERLRSQITSLAEENNQVNEIYMSTKNELVKLQEQLEVEKSKLDAMVSEIKNLNVVAAEKSVLESNYESQLKDEVEKVAELTSRLHEHEMKASQLHKELQESHTVISEEKEVVSQKHSELEATLKKSQEELEAKKSMIVHLESMLKDLEQKVQLADAKSKETETTGKGEVQVKSRDIDLSFSTPKQLKSKKESVASPSRNVTTQKPETSHLMTLKIILGVALVSIIIGIILGKKY